ncbi:MAG: hypothetical protein LBF12_07120 [Christensenellaceae bacterium]|jgi:FKBP-type peptidyl-prolyl cis-trans isomerase (trigger factor)|nr:hypothetical protein [Christensenellaceae bacterium]
MSYIVRKTPNYFTLDIEISLEGEELNELLKSVYNKKKGQIKLEGFRPGKVPFHLGIKRYKLAYFVDDVCSEKIKRDMLTILQKIRTTGNEMIQDLGEYSFSDFNFVEQKDYYVYSITNITEESVSFVIRLDYFPAINLSDRELDIINRSYYGDNTNIDLKVDRLINKLVIAQSRTIPFTGNDDNLVDISSYITIITYFEDNEGKFISLNDASICGQFKFALNEQNLPQDIKTGLLGMKLYETKIIPVHIEDIKEKFYFDCEFYHKKDFLNDGTVIDVKMHVCVTRFDKIITEPLNEELLKDFSDFDSVEQLKEYFYELEKIKSEYFFNVIKYVDRIVEIKEVLNLQPSICIINARLEGEGNEAIERAKSINKLINSNTPFIDIQKYEQFLVTNIEERTTLELASLLLKNEYRNKPTIIQMIIEEFFSIIQQHLKNSSTIYSDTTFFVQLRTVLNQLQNAFIKENDNVESQDELNKLTVEEFKEKIKSILGSNGYDISDNMNKLNDLLSLTITLESISQDVFDDLYLDVEANVRGYFTKKSTSNKE